GTTALVICILGLFDIWADSPATAHLRAHAGGAIGAVIGGPLSHGVSAILAAPLLLIVGAFGALVVTATPFSVLVGYIRDLVTGGPIEEDDEEQAFVEEPVTAPKRRRLRTPKPDEV